MWWACGVQTEDQEGREVQRGGGGRGGSRGAWGGAGGALAAGGGATGGARGVSAEGSAGEVFRLGRRRLAPLGLYEWSRAIFMPVRHI